MLPGQKITPTQRLSVGTDRQTLIIPLYFWKMKLTYAIPLEEFRTWQPAFTTQAVRNAGFQAALSVCVLVSLLGADLWVQGYGSSVGWFLMSLGVVAAAASYLLDQQSVRKARERYERSILLAYQRVHCREQRSFEAGEDGFTRSCRCGTITRPWSELTRFSEGKSLFFLGSHFDGVVVLKSAFASEGEITEFRKLVVDKLNQNRPATSRPLDFAHTSDDYRDAYFLHLLRAGGWRAGVGNLGKQILFAYVAFAIWKFTDPGSAHALGVVLAAAFLGANFLRIALMQGRHYWGPLRLYFTEAGLYSQDPGTLVWTPWKQFVGYLESDKIFLIYYNPRLYRIIPKRALAGRDDEIRAVLEANLPSYDYRTQAPGRVALTGLSSQV